MEHFDAVVVGLGPVGATLTNLLGQAGLKTAVIEKQAEVHDKPRAIGIDHESLRTLQSLGISDEMSSLISPYRGGVYLGADGQPIRTFIPAPPPYLLAWPPNATFIQPELEGLLRKSASDLPNVSVALRTELHGIEELDTCHFSLSLRSEHARQQISTKYLFGCDGAGSFVRRFFGTDFEDLNFDEWWVVIDAWVSDLDVVPASSRQYCFPSRPATYVVGPRNLRRWEFKLLPGETPQQFASNEAVLRILEDFVDTRPLEVWRIAPYRFHALVANTWRYRNAFLVGDAAHQTPPFLGQGMNSGIRDAANLAWKIELVEKYGAHASLLDSYQAERKPHFRSVVARAKELGLIIGELDPQRARERDCELRKLAAEGKLETSRQSFIPRLSNGLLSERPLNPDSPVGLPFAQPLVRCDGRERLLDDLSGPTFRVVLTEAEQVGWISHTEHCLLQQMNAQVILLCADVDRATLPPWMVWAQLIDSTFDNWAAKFGARAFIVRPDHYVYGTASTEQRLRTCLAEMHCALFTATSSDKAAPPGSRSAR